MFIIADRLGMTVGQLSLSMGAYELSEWIAYLEIMNRKESK